jgi:hypothetical protein
MFAAARQFNGWYRKTMMQIKRRHYRMPSFEILSESKWFTSKFR